MSVDGRSCQRCFQHSLLRRYVPSGRFAGPTLKPLRFLTGESLRDPFGVFSASCERLGAMMDEFAGCKEGEKRRRKKKVAIARPSTKRSGTPTSTKARLSQVLGSIYLLDNGVGLLNLVCFL